MNADSNFNSFNPAAIYSSALLISVHETATYVKVLLELDVTLSAKVDFSQDGISSLGGRLVTHLLHGIDQVGSSDLLIVILSGQL